MFGDRQFALRQLVTDPEYWRRGAARMLLKWGMKRARGEAKAIMLFASSAGMKVYEKVGFREVGRARCCVEEEGDGMVLWVPALVRDPLEGKGEEDLN